MSSEGSPSLNYRRLAQIKRVLTSTLDVDLVAILLVTFAGLAFVFLPYLNQTFIRSLLGLILIFFVSGYAFIAALFPERTSISNATRVALSVGFSMVIVPLAALSLNYVFGGVLLGSIMIFMTFFVVICTIFAKMRRGALPFDQRFHVSFDVAKLIVGVFPPSERRGDRLLSVILILSILLLASTVAYTLTVPQSERYTNFYLLGADGKIGNYPVQYRLGEQKPVLVGITNEEQHAVTYNLVVRLNDSNSSTTIFSQKVSLADGQKWEQQVNLKPDRTGNHMKMQFLLYRDNETTAPYRETDLWVTVT